MGLIRAAVTAVGSELHDQWKDFIKCEDMDMNTLMIKKTTKNGVITKGSGIIVAPGQIAVIYDQGKILDATAEEGVYTFDQNTSPSFFSGDFGAVFKDMWARFTYGGVAAKDQAVFFINAKDIIDNKFGTPAPIPFEDYSHIIPNEMTGEMAPMRLEIKCFGKYTYKISDPAAFMREYAGTADIVTKDEINEQMRSEVIATLQAVINSLGSNENKVRVLELPRQTEKMKELMDEKVFDENIRKRGISITSFLIESVTPTDESNKKIDEYEHNSNSRMQQGKVLEVMDHAAQNPGGAGNGFMGVGMMNMATGGMTTGVMQNAFNNSNTVTNEAPLNQGTANFCTNCGTKLEGAKFCPKCGTKVE